MRNVKSLFHINFPTQKWDEMVDFYVNVCGFDQAFVIYSADMKRMFGQERHKRICERANHIRRRPKSNTEDRE